LSNSVFAPTNFSSLQLWLDASDVGTISTVSGFVSRWYDKTSNAYQLTQDTDGSRPAYVSSINQVTFSNDRFLNIPQASINNAASYTYYFVFTPVAALNWIMVKQHNGVNTYNNLSMTNYSGSGGANTAGTSQYLYFHPYNAGGIANSGTALSLNTLQLIGMNYDGTTFTITRNGTQLSSAAGAYAIQNATNATNFTMGLWNTGTIQNSGTTHFRMSEFLFYNTGLGAPDRQTVEGYLAWKWGLQWSIPQTHPYKYNNPASLGPFTSPVTTNLQVYLTPNTYAGSGTTWDNIQNATDATLINTPTYNIINGFTFNGTNQAATLPDTTGVTDFSITDNYTIEVWFNAAATQATTSPDNSIVEKWDSAAGTGYPYVCRWVPTGTQVKFAVYNGTITQEISMSTSAGIWIQAVGVFNHTSDLLSGYINGQFVTSTALPIIGAINNASLLNLARRGGATSVPFTGSIGNLRIYNTALTASQILQNFQADRGRYGI
jgi:hypothetical protein